MVRKNKEMYVIVVMVFILLSACAQTTNTKARAVCKGSAQCLYGKVTYIMDGDTIDVENKRIRLAIVNTPEKGEPLYQEAKDFIESLCPVGSYATVDQDDIQIIDTTGTRMVGLLWCDNVNVNEVLLEKALLEYILISAVLQANLAMMAGLSGMDAKLFMLLLR